MATAPSQGRETPRDQDHGKQFPAPPPPAPDRDLARSLRVAIVSDAAPERNGVGTYYRDLAAHLKSVGAKVDIISPRFRRGNWYGGLGMPLPGDPTQKFVVPSYSLVAKRMQRLRPNAVVIPTPGPFGMLGMYLARRYEARLVVGFHTHFERLAEMNHHSALFGYLAQSYLNACNRKLFRASDLVLANSGEMVEIARDIGADRVGLMGTPIPGRLLDTPPRPIGNRVERVLFAGRLAPEKNLDALVEAAERLPDMEFMVAGDGPLRGWLEEKAENLDNLDYVGWVRRSRVMPLLDAADVLVLPSTVESFGTIALEAMARARIVVVSAQCGILSWDELNRGLFQIGETEHLSDTLRRIGALDHAILTRKGELARDGARRINDRNLQHWLDILGKGELRGIHEHAEH